VKPRSSSAFWKVEREVLVRIFPQARWGEGEGGESVESGGKI